MTPIEILDELKYIPHLRLDIPVDHENILNEVKLYRLSAYDKADIIALIKSGRISNLSEFDLPDDKISAYEELIELAKTDLHPG